MRLSYFALALALMVPASFSLGAVVTLGGVGVTVGVDGNPWQLSPTFTDNGDGTFSSIGSTTGAAWDFSWNMTVKPDPFVDAVFGFKNTTAVTQTFTVGVLLPVAPPQTPFTRVGGSIGVTLTDSNFNGFAQLTDAGNGIYFGQNDGVNVLELFADPFALTVNTAGGSNVASDFQGLPTPNVPGPAATSTISIVHRFRLSPGDSVAFTSFYVVEAVPEASTLLLTSLGVAGIVAVSRRRSISR
ncbi:hypothetical protein K2X85_20500 [bacterium]|nr:hypothetical protein [bacterium]